jgi:putative Mn2+ efflux pump MntP
MLQVVLIFCGLSLDSVIVMMQKGAQLRKKTVKDLLLYSLVFALVTAGMLLCGYIVSRILERFIPDGMNVNITIAALIVLFVGAFLMTKSIMKKGFEEKVDKDFNYHKLCRQAVYTSIDTFFVGIAVGFMGIGFLGAMNTALIVTFVSVFIALLIGYNLGARYQRAVGVVGGALMVFFSIYIVIKFVIRVG